MPPERVEPSSNERSAFRDFMSTLRKSWRAKLPIARPIENPLGPSMPKASTFYLGATKSGLQLFLNFQHHSKAWRVGQFTINVILSETIGQPSSIGPGIAPEDWARIQPGTYRIGTLLARKDKWWHLLQEQPERLVQSWFATNYGNRELVVEEAIEDVTRDVRALLDRVQVVTAERPGA